MMNNTFFSCVDGKEGMERDKERKMMEDGGWEDERKILSE